MCVSLPTTIMSAISTASRSFDSISTPATSVGPGGVVGFAPPQTEDECSWRHGEIEGKPVWFRRPEPICQFTRHWHQWVPKRLSSPSF